MYCVYKLQNNRGEIYFGKTLNPKKRWNKHRSINNDCTSSILWEDNGIVEDIEVLEKFDTEEEALQREKELIRNNNCVNMKGNRGTRQEYREKNKEKILAYKKEYHEKNKEKILAYKKEYYENNKDETIAYMKEYYENNREKLNAQRSEKIKCNVCGSMISRTNIAQHQRTAKCKSFINALEPK